MDEDSKEHPAIENIVYQQLTDDSDILTFRNIYINNQDDIIAYGKNTNMKRRESIVKTLL